MGSATSQENPGHPVVRQCVDCHVDFTAYEGKVTFKGAEPIAVRCAVCYRVDQAAKMTSLLSNQSEQNFH